MLGVQSSSLWMGWSPPKALLSNALSGTIFTQGLTTPSTTPSNPEYWYSPATLSLIRTMPCIAASSSSIRYSPATPRTPTPTFHPFPSRSFSALSPTGSQSAFFVQSHTSASIANLPNSTGTSPVDTSIRGHSSAVTLPFVEVTPCHFPTSASPCVSHSKLLPKSSAHRATILPSSEHPLLQTPLDEPATMLARRIASV